jgi:hypothetical protein
MPSIYNFKEDVEVYVVSGGTTYRIYVSNITFSQTFSEQSYPVATIHSPSDLFEESVINAANIANFSFEVPVVTQKNRYSILHSLLVNATEFDLYIKTQADTYRLRKSVMTTGNYVIERSRPLALQISGEAAQLYRGVSGFTPSSAFTDKTYIIPKVEVYLDGPSLMTDVVSVSMELQNEIQWTGYKTVNNAISATTMYPSGFTLSKRILAGSIAQYLTDTTTSYASDFNADGTLDLRAGTSHSGNSSAIGADFKGFHFDGPISYTTRVNTGSPVFLRNYDWRCLSIYPANLATKLNYDTD